MKKKAPLSQLDVGFLALLLVLSALGLSVLWSACHDAGGDVAPYAWKQLQWFLLAAAALAAVAAVDYRHLQTYAVHGYVTLVVLLGAVLLVGKVSMGAQRWLALGPIRLQPSEFMKIGVAVMTANLLSRDTAPPPYGLRSLWLPGLAAGVPTALILLQPDLGTALLVVAVACAVVLFQGVQWRLLAWAGGAFVAALPAAWAGLRDYQRLRILTFLSPERDPMGAGYHIIQSKIAVGSGQFLGKGFLHSTQGRLQFLPERHTDFIFSVLAEEWGFLGSALVLLLYALLVLWGLDIAAKARDTFGRLLAVGVTSILFFHVVVNVGMVTGCLPVVGVPLPLFSYGGSSVLTTYLVAGILLNVRLRRFSRGL
ncbi:MAG: rod shape-determining protein RodA [Deltaproteobacteria bacterium]|nr:rod shape-determining protein RodA [Deltaproteobacteria bacterium]